MTIPAELVEKFKAGGTEKREACSTLLDSIYSALKTVTVNAESYETLMVKKKYTHNLFAASSSILVDSSSQKTL